MGSVPREMRSRENAISKPKYVSECKLKFLIFSIFWPEMDPKWSKIIYLT